MNEPILELLEKFLRAKEAEVNAIAMRVQLAEEIAQHLDGPDEGSKTHKLGSYTATVKRAMNRKVNWELFNQISANKQNIPVKTKQELDEVGLRWVKENDPSYYRQLCESITTKPARVAVEVKNA